VPADDQLIDALRAGLAAAAEQALKHVGAA
jgi:hypothetical protein